MIPTLYDLDLRNERETPFRKNIQSGKIFSYADYADKLTNDQTRNIKEVIQMEYEELKVPHKFIDTGGYDNFSAKEAREYFKWYIDCIPERIEYLKEYVQKFQNNPMDYSLESLYLLDDWFLTQIEYEYRTEDEIMEYCRLNYFTESVDVLSLSEKTRWTDYTYALMYDIARYYGEVMIRNINGMRWGVKTGSKNWVYKNKPVVFNDNSNYFAVSPADTVDVRMCKYINKSRMPSSFRDIFAEYIKEFGVVGNNGNMYGL